MKTPGLKAIAIWTGLAFSAGAAAQTLSEVQYKAAKNAIAAEHTAAKSACGTLSGNANDICKAEAGGNEKVARAELEERYKPSVDARYKVRIARAEANFAVARQNCDDKAGNVKDVCIKEAKASEVADKADARAKMKIANANDVASEKGADARRNAAADKRDADYAVAKEKCDAFAGDAKSNCVQEAKTRFGKS